MINFGASGSTLCKRSNKSRLPNSYPEPWPASCLLSSTLEFQMTWQTSLLAYPADTSNSRFSKLNFNLRASPLSATQSPNLETSEWSWTSLFISHSATSWWLYLDNSSDLPPCTLPWSISTGQWGTQGGTYLRLGVSRQNSPKKTRFNRSTHLSSISSQEWVQVFEAWSFSNLDVLL